MWLSKPCTGRSGGCLWVTGLKKLQLQRYWCSSTVSDASKRLEMTDRWVAVDCQFKGRQWSQRVATAALKETVIPCPLGVLLGLQRDWAGRESASGYGQEQPAGAGCCRINWSMCFAGVDASALLEIEMVHEGSGSSLSKWHEKLEETVGWVPLSPTYLSLSAHAGFLDVLCDQLQRREGWRPGLYISKCDTSALARHRLTLYCSSTQIATKGSSEKTAQGADLWVNKRERGGLS